MRKFFISVFLFAVLASALFQTSCTPGSCFEETNAFVKTTFYLSTSLKADAPDSISVYGAGRDTSFIYYKARNISQALLPLDASKEGCSIVIRINGVNDTISFVYSTSSHMISKECGYTFYHTIDAPSYTANIIDTVTVVKNTITTLSEENIRIYY